MTRLLHLLCARSASCLISRQWPDEDASSKKPAALIRLVYLFALPYQVPSSRREAAPMLTRFARPRQRLRLVRLLHARRERHHQKDSNKLTEALDEFSL
jgi:hypothetical protein